MSKKITRFKQWKNFIWLQKDNNVRSKGNIYVYSIEEKIFYLNLISTKNI